MDHRLADETQLIQSMLAGDERAFNASFEAYFARVYRFALPRLNGDVDATRIVVGRQEPGRQPSVTSNSANPAT